MREYVDLSKNLDYNKKHSNEIKEINGTIKNNLNKKSLPVMVRSIINKDKTDSYIVRVNIMIFFKRQTNILIGKVFLLRIKVCF